MLTQTPIVPQDENYLRELEESFPTVDPGFTPLGERVLVQIRTPKTKSKGGILLTENAKDTEKWNTQIARVHSVGPLAYHNRTDLSKWPEGDWVAPGDFVRCPKYGGDRFEVPIPGRQGEFALFVTFQDHEMIGKVLGNPLEMKVYV